MTLRIDPHAHTLASDGTDTPTGLMHAAARAGLDVVAITDHDTTAGWREAEDAVAASGVALLRGVEISCSAGGITTHLLCYLHDPDDDRLAGMFRASRAVRESRARTMVERLGADYPLSWPHVVASAGPGATIGRPHIADALVARGAAASRSDAFARLLHPGSPYYVRYDAPDPVDVVRRVRAAGGVPVLAHPRARVRQRVLIGVDVIEDMARAGLFGIEADHPDQDDAARREVRDIAARLALRVTGSSDYHGTGKTTRLGDNLTAPGVLAAIEAEGAVRVVRP